MAIKPGGRNWPDFLIALYSLRVFSKFFLLFIKFADARSSGSPHSVDAAGHNPYYVALRPETALDGRGMAMKKNLTGQSFGRLTVLEEAPGKGNGRRYWRCRCGCGAETLVEEYHLKSGHTKSCGCYRRELPSKKRTDLTGQRFGRLTALGSADKTVGPPGKWRCRCDCGQEIICSRENLHSGATKSCGCLREEVRRENMKKAIHFVDGTCVERIASRKNCANNTTGHRGVYRRQNNRWRAAIGFKGKVYNLGTYESFQDAVNARLEAEKNLYDAFLDQYRGQGTEGVSS